jgi:hypothetical protein
MNNTINEYRVTCYHRDGFQQAYVTAAFEWEARRAAIREFEALGEYNPLDRVNPRIDIIRVRSAS